jgi:hypothetical protein
MPKAGKTLVFLPILFLFLFYTVLSVQSFHKICSLDRAFEVLFAGDALSEQNLEVFQSFNSDTLFSYMAGWRESKQEAALLLLGYQGIFLEKRMSDEAFPHAEAGLEGRDRANEESQFSAIDQLVRNDPEAAEDLLKEQWLDYSLNPELTPQDGFFSRIRTVVLRTNTSDFWIEALLGWSGLSDSGFDAAFLLASCYESVGSWEDALFWYEQAGSRGNHWKETRRSQWYRMRLIIRNSPERLPNLLLTLGTVRNEDAYFDDILDDYFSVLVRRRGWTELAQLLPLLNKAGLSGPASQGMFLLNRAGKEGSLFWGDSEFSTDDLVLDPKGYYALRVFPESWPYILNSENQDSMQDPNDSSYMDELLMYLIHAGYEVEAYRLWMEDKPSLSPETVMTLCRYLEDRGDLYDLITFAGYWYYNFPIETALKLLPWVFPGAERYDFTEGDVPEELILGIIRRESAFHETISSRAGAGGLMQLMPSTAGDLAQKHRMEDWDLMKAEDNILLGTLYLEWLQERPWTSSFIDVLAAYNGGGGNLRSWKRLHPFDDPDLFIQSIPFRETRDYVRKVIVAAASYRYLETGDPPGEWLDQFYRLF